MLTCNCTLIGSEACKSCSRMMEYQNSFKDISGGTGRWEPFIPTTTYPYPEPKVVKRITRTIEKYDPQGNLIAREVITEEEEIIKPNWEIGPTIISGTISISDSNSSDYSPNFINGKITTYRNYDPAIPYTYTKNLSSCPN